MQKCFRFCIHFLGLEGTVPSKPKNGSERNESALAHILREKMSNPELRQKANSRCSARKKAKEVSEVERV